MKNLLSKTLLCGVLATSFVLINCQKAPARKVTPDATGFQKPGDLKKSGPCNPAGVSAYDAAKTALDALKADAAKPNPDAAALSAQLVEVKKLIDAAKTAIATSRKENDADECVKENKEDPKKPATLSAADFAEPYTKLAAFIKGIGGTVPPPSPSALKVNDKIELSQAAAALFTNPENGCGALGQPQSTEKCTELAANPANTICSFTGDGKPVVGGAKGAISAMNKSEDQKSLAINITLDPVAAAEGQEAETARLVSINCALGTEAKVGEKAAEAATAALGVLVKKAPAAAETQGEGDKAEGEKAEEKPEESKPAVSDELAAAAQEGLNILGPQ